jgi:cell division protein FtsZ
LKEEVDTLLVLPNQKLLNMESSTFSLDESFQVVDQVLCDAVRGMTEIITTPGLINLDFADVRAILQSSGKAIFGMATAATATKAVEMALSNPLVGGSPDGARGCLLNITAGPDLSLQDFSEASRRLQESAAPDAMVLCGFVQDPTMMGRARATVVATRVKTSNGELTQVHQSFEGSRPVSEEQEILPLAKAALPHTELTAFERRRKAVPQEPGPQSKQQSFAKPSAPQARKEPAPNANRSPREGLTRKEGMGGPSSGPRPGLQPKTSGDSDDKKGGWMNLPAIWRRSKEKNNKPVKTASR